MKIDIWRITTSTLNLACSQPHRQRERQRQRDTDTETDREREKQRQRETQTDSDRDRDRQTETEAETERDVCSWTREIKCHPARRQTRLRKTLARFIRFHTQDVG